MKRWVRIVLVAALAAVAVHGVQAQITPLPQDRGATGLGLALRRPGVTARVLYVTAHPDDEHNGVLVRLSQGLGVRTAILTLTRGEGGQNEIGPELFDALGVLRTEELAAVHRYDAAEQYFGRAYEFGYSFSVDETFARWGREETLEDVVRVVRTFRPDVILTLPLEAPGGGQHHQAAAQLAREAFRAAADPGRFPDQVQSGLRPWQPRKIYQGAVGVSDRETPPGAVLLKTSVHDPLLGMSWQQLGSMARASHRSQGASQIVASPGSGSAGYALVDSEPPLSLNEADILDGLDPTLQGLLRFVDGNESAVPFLATDLQALQARIEAARAALDPGTPEKTLPSLQAALEGVRRLRQKLETSRLPETPRAEIQARLADEEQDLAGALALAHGLTLEILSDDDQVIPGQPFQVTARVWNQGKVPVSVQGLEAVVSAGWAAKRTQGSEGALGPGTGLSVQYAVSAAPDARPSQPYWRRSEGRDRLEVLVPEHETRPWSPPDVSVKVLALSANVPFTVEGPAVWRYEGRAGGEKQRVVSVVPVLSVKLAPAVTVIPRGVPRVSRELQVTVANGQKGPAAASVRLEAPTGWTVEPQQASLAFRHEGEEVAVRFQVTATDPAAGLYLLRAVALQDGRQFREGYEEIAYDHVHARPIVRPAEARALALDVKTTPGISVGYVMGAGDEVATAIRQLGVPVTLLAAEDLAFGDLSRYTTIVTGIRAYQTRPDLKSYHHRLRRFMEGGGHLVVQYNKFEFNQLAEKPQAGEFAFTRPATGDSPFAPYPAAVTADRVTDEKAPVTVLMPGHPLLMAPNVLGQVDWEGWVQERGLYFLQARDPRHVDLLSFRDPFPKNPGDKKGALVEAKVGRGTWTYVGLGLFRQLPAGVPGAYRLLANLIGRPRG